MVEQQPAGPAQPASPPPSAWQRLRAEGRNPDGTRRRAPAWALAVMMLCSGLLVPVLLLGNSQDLAYSATTTGTQRAGGEDTSYRSNNTTVDSCRDAPVDFEVDGTPYAGTDVISGTCLAEGDTRQVTVRYVPDDPQDFTTSGRQWILHGFVALAALGFLACLVALVRRLLARRRQARAREE